MTVTMHMIGCCKTVKEFGYLKRNYYAFMENESAVKHDWLKRYLEGSVVND